MVNSDIIESNKVSDTKNPLIHCNLFVSKVENGDILSTGQYKSHQSSTNLQIKKLQNFFRSMKIEQRDTTG